MASTGSLQNTIRPPSIFMISVLHEEDSTSEGAGDGPLANRTVTNLSGRSMNVTLLISLSVVIPDRTLSSADSRRNRMPSSRRRAGSRGRLLGQNILADTVGQIQKFMDGSRLKPGTRALDATRPHRAEPVHC